MIGYHLNVADYFRRQMDVRDSAQEELEEERSRLLEKENALLANLAGLTKTQAELISIQKAKDEEIQEKVDALCKKDEALRQCQKLLAEAQGTVTSQKQMLGDLQQKLGVEARPAFLHNPHCESK